MGLTVSKREVMKRLPTILMAVRAACAPALIAGERLGAPGAFLACLVAVAFVTDIFDGVVARRLGVATERLRRADTVIDAIFYLSATVALGFRAPAVLEHSILGVMVLVLLELSRLLLERAKFGRIAAYHLWSAKMWGIALWLGFSEAFLTGQPGPLFQAAIFVGIMADLEGLWVSIVLSAPRHDLPTVWHAFQAERAAEARK
jgi:phosphatidylglycerophosphate synthase